MIVTGPWPGGDERRDGLLQLVGTGPGALDQMTLAAQSAIRAAEAVVGYELYVDLVRPLIAAGTAVHASPIGAEVERARLAIELAAAGRRVALISSGDIGIYGMAGPVFELLAARGWQPGSAPAVELLPGVSAVQGAAALLGAPLMHDFCTISLSDLLTPWAVIQRRVRAAAEGDFIVAFYNPRSRQRQGQLGWALALLRAHRPPTTPVALVRDAYRDGQAVTVATLDRFDPAAVEMRSLVLVGNSQSRLLGRAFFTPRGYAASIAAGEP